LARLAVEGVAPGAAVEGVATLARRRPLWMNPTAPSPLVEGGDDYIGWRAT
jgi:hypothetical protein